MARKWNLFFSRLSILILFLLGIFLSFLPIFYQTKVVAQTPSELNQRGFIQLHQGQASAALQTWESAYRVYQKWNDLEGMTGSLVNQSLALQADALYPRACQTLIQALEMSNWVCRPMQLQEFSQTEYQERLRQTLENQPMQKVRVIGLRNLGDVLRQLGKPHASAIVLNKAWEIAQSLGMEASHVLLSLANTEHSLYDQAKSAKSLALGTLAHAYIHLGQEPEAIKYLRQAMGLAQSVQGWDIAYQWQWQLGQLYKKNNKLKQARQAYASAVNSLEQVRGSILSINPEIQFTFKDKVEPVYQEYMELLLSVEQPNFQQVIRTQEQLKLAELENFLQCGIVPNFSLLDAQNSVKLPHTIYLIKLPNKTEVILRTSQGRFFHHTLNTELIDYPVNELINFVQNQHFDYFAETDFLLYSQELYKLLLAPIKEHLPKTGNLLFVLDTYFQNLPMSLLHDGNNYLIHDYTIAVASSSQFSQKQVLKAEKLQALIAAISEESPSFYGNFNALPEVEAEIENIRKNLVYTSELLNNQFTSERFREKIDNQPLPVIHVSTHAQFSSDPEQTFILAWDRPINLHDLNNLFKRQNTESSIDLLVLSACQTAKGDRRSALGIAGLATQSGARSTIATLWLVNSESTALLMSRFYQGLRNGLPKAEALRQAQLDLRSHAQYSHPYHWAAFVLVGAWD
jgi:CHAT domain-containing protein